MRFKKSFKIALNIILHSRLRSWLTIIGIVIGIGAIVAIISVGQGAEKSLERNLNALSADIITVTPDVFRASGPGAGFRQASEFQASRSSSEAKNLTVRDATFLKSVPNVEYVMGTISGNAEATYLGKTARVSVQGVDTGVWKDIVSTELESGRYLNKGELGVIVVGSRIQSSVFTDLQVNRQINIEGKSFRVVGVLKQSGTDDSRVFMPIENALTVLEDKDEKNFDAITVKIRDISLSDETATQIESKLMLSHGILQESKKDFTVTSLKSIQERVSSALSSMSLFLSSIAAISLVVGSIGIMNTMFTSVLEKTKEIGVLKAIGATNRDILAIFLMNAGIIGLIGGIFGVVLGVVSSSFIVQMIGMDESVGRFRLSSAYVDPKMVLGVFAISILVGLLAGAIPAYRASKLKPVDALRYE
ncbi:hypothetical protein A3K63_04715 [Candidatus Micrarchaeota archaeon RBG_16_49_10]|nr:MAG: hypothetical protein A3K63_04715 [Candidatus Micrarchaeota archaeon RBG_16_49_10]